MGLLAILQRQVLEGDILLRYPFHSHHKSHRSHFTSGKEGWFSFGLGFLRIGLLVTRAAHPLLSLHVVSAPAPQNDAGGNRHDKHDEEKTTHRPARDLSRNARGLTGGVSDLGLFGNLGRGTGLERRPCEPRRRRKVEWTSNGTSVEKNQDSLVTQFVEGLDSWATCNSTTKVSYLKNKEEHNLHL